MSKTISYDVKGTKCASCEIIIEREIKKIPGVASVNASHAKGEVTLHLEDGAHVNPKQLESILAEHGYRFAERSKAKEGGKPTTWNWPRIGWFLVLVIALYLILKQTGLLTLTPNVESIGNLSGVFIVGLVAAFSSCTAVLSGLVAAVSASSAKHMGTEVSLEKRMRPHYLFNIGRLVGFVVFGAMIGWVGQVVQLSAGLNGLFVLVIALLMIGLGVNLLDVIPKGIGIKPPKWLSHKIHDLSSSHRPSVPFALGALTFFLPCGFTQAMQLFALSLGDPKASAMVMGVFALGTIPALLGIGAITTRAKGVNLKRITQVAGVLVLVLGLSNVENGLALLGVSASAFATSDTATIDQEIVLKDGVQVIEMDVTSRGTYEPDVLTVKEGIPVRWEITGADFMGCGNTLMMRTFGVNTRLQSGLNVVEFTPTKTGNFTFSCSMGMIRGTMIVVPQES